MAEKRRTSSATIVKLVSVAVLALFLIVVGISQRQAIYDQLYDWELIPRPERLTELYFTDHTNLPTTYKPDETQIVKFTVRNLEYRDTDYTYAVTVQNENSEEPLNRVSGSFKLAHEQLQNIEAPITITAKGPRARVIVTIYYQGIKFGEDDLSDQEQSIHYWVKDPEAPNVAP
jgi:uncharacterized membrane protein